MMRKGHVQYLVQKYNKSEYVVDQESIGTKKKLRNVQTTKLGPKWDNKNRHSLEEFPTYRRSSRKDLGSPTYVWYSPRQSVDNLQENRYKKDASLPTSVWYSAGKRGSDFRADKCQKDSCSPSTNRYHPGDDKDNLQSERYGRDSGLPTSVWYSDVEDTENLHSNEFRRDSGLSTSNRQYSGEGKDNLQSDGYERDSGLSTSVWYSDDEGSGNPQLDGYRYISESANSPKYALNDQNSKLLQKSNQLSVIGNGIDLDNNLSDKGTNDDNPVILDKVELPLKADVTKRDGLYMQPDCTLSSSRRGYDMHDVDHTSGGSRQDVDGNYSDESENWDENVWGSDFSSDEYSESKSDTNDSDDEIQFDSKQQKLYRIADELVNTEKTYVKNLHLLDQVFHKRLQSENDTEPFLPAEVIPQIFSNVGSIYQFHSEVLLPKLEERMHNWVSITKIGDIMTEVAPSFEFYTEFMKNFDNAMHIIKTWEEKCPKFAEILKEIQSTPDCNQLCLTHHMLGPVQRLPRYELLLKDYIKHLPEDSEDLSDANEALMLVTEAASKANEALTNKDYHKLMEINEKLGGVIDLKTPARHFITEGTITKITARRGCKQERYLFLFNDLLLVCSQLLGTLKLKNCLDIDGMEVIEKGDAEYIQLINGEENLDIPDTFYVRSRKKILQFCYGNDDNDNTNWCKLIKKVIEQSQGKRRLYLREDKKENQENSSDSTSFEFELGETAPKWIKDYEVTMCMKCGNQFTTLRRRHHCRACGLVVCGNCSDKKIALPYDDNNINRVCVTCYGLLNTKKMEVFSDYLYVSKDNGKTWKKRWFSVKTDGCLYYHITRKDIFPAGSYNLKIFTIEKLASDENIFTLTDGSVLVYLYSDTEETNRKWIDILKKMVSSKLQD